MSSIALLRNEFRLVRRHPLLWSALVGAVLFAVMFSRGATGVPPEEAIFELLRLNMMVPVLFLPVIAGALAPIILLREVDHGMDEIAGSYPLGPRRWLSSRVGALFAILLLASFIFQQAFLVIVAGDQQGMSAALASRSLLWALAVHAPASLLWASGMAWLACRRAHSGLLYAVAGFVWIAYLGIATVTGTALIAGSFVIAEQARAAMLLLDPYAASALLGGDIEATQRAMLVGLGRVFWVGVAIVLLRSIKTVPSNANKKEGSLKRSLASLISAGASDIPRWRLHYALHLKFVIRDLVFPLLILGWATIVFTGALGGIDYAEPLSRIDPDSRDALGRVAWDTLLPVGALILLYVADRICRLYSTTRMHELYAASPHRALALVAVQIAAILSIASIIVLLAGLAVIAAQLIAGSAVNLAEYGFQLAPLWSQLALFSAVYVAIHGLVRWRLVANLTGFAIMALGTSRLLGLLGLHHPLLRPLGSPLSAPDHVWGYGGLMHGHYAFMLFWMLVAGGLVALAVAVHHRSMTSVQRPLAKRLRQPVAILTLLALGGAAIQGQVIHQELAEEGALTTPDDRVRWRANYELKYANWRNHAQPDVVAIKSNIDFDPPKHSVRVTADLILQNRSSEPIKRILVGRNQRTGGSSAVINVDGGTLAEHDKPTGQRIYVLDEALLPGDSLVLGYESTFSQSAYTSPEIPLVLRDEFSMFGAFAFLPVVGFDPELTLRNPISRRDYGLPEVDIIPPSDLNGRKVSLEGERVMLETVVSTVEGHHLIAQGERVASWRSNGRSFARFRTRQPIRNLPAFFSVPWQAHADEISGVDAYVYAPGAVGPGSENVLAIKDTVAWLDRDVAAYPGDELHFVAVPEIGFSGFALPQIVLVSNRLAFRAEPEAKAGFSQIYRRAAHEVAHQWFGHLLGYGIAEERAFLVESLAKYVELAMIDARYGSAAAEAIVAWEWSRYRSSLFVPDAPIAPFIDGETQADQYSRATIVFACLRERVGDAAITAAARAMAERSANENRAMRSIDFVAAMKESAGAGNGDFVDEMLLGTTPIAQSLESAGCPATWAIIQQG